jgi:hypothetical protein
MSQLCAHVNEPSTSVNYDMLAKFPCIVPSFASRGLSCLCGSWRLWWWMRGTQGGQGYNRPTGCSAEKAPHANFFISAFSSCSHLYFLSCVITLSVCLYLSIFLSTDLFLQVNRTTELMLQYKADGSMKQSSPWKANNSPST